jgi:putative oxidoreductase
MRWTLHRGCAGGAPFIAQVFLSGLTKLRDWAPRLFTDEYKVPLLSPILPPSWARPVSWCTTCCSCWLAGRFAALGLSVVNVVAVVALQ